MLRLFTVRAMLIDSSRTMSVEMTGAMFMAMSEALSKAGCIPWSERDVWYTSFAGPMPMFGAGWVTWSEWGVL